MSLKAGSINDFVSSMASAMENAFTTEWGNAMTGDAPPANNQSRLLFVAIAQGIVNYLNANPDAFKVIVSDGINIFTGDVYSIDKQ